MIHILNSPDLSSFRLICIREILIFPASFHGENHRGGLQRGSLCRHAELCDQVGVARDQLGNLINHMVKSS